MGNNNNTQKHNPFHSIEIRKEVIEAFEKQNPQGYFHLLYLVQELKSYDQEKLIKRLRGDITDLNEHYNNEIKQLKKSYKAEKKGLIDHARITEAFCADCSEAIDKQQPTKRGAKPCQNPK